MSDHDVETNVLSNLMHIVILIIVGQICIFFQVIHWIFPPYYVQIITTFFNKVLKLGQINVIVPCLFIAIHVVQVNLTQF